MNNEFTAVIEQDGDWYIGFCPEIPEANGQGLTVDECHENLSQAIALILQAAAKMRCEVAQYKRVRQSSGLSTRP